MQLIIQTEIECYDKRGKVLVQNKQKTEACKGGVKVKRFIKSVADIEDAIRSHITKLTKSIFNADLAEAITASPFSLTYHQPLGKEHKMFMIRVECEGKKIEFPDYYIE